jgi:hypothetical protein
VPILKVWQVLQVGMRLVKNHLIRPISIAYDIPGVTVSIVKDDKLIFAKGYGKPKIKLETE